jgi:magnesium chelatase family protein
VAAVPAHELQSEELAESSGEIRARVVAARERQLQRSGVLNARLHGRALRARATLSADAGPMVTQAMARLSLSARAYDRVLRVARTIADLEGIEQTSAQHVAEALQFRGH